MTLWSTPDDVVSAVRRHWASGALLTAYGRDEPFPVIDVPLRGPRAGEVGADLERVRQWADRLERGAPGCYRLASRTVGGRAIGRNHVPARATVSSYPQAWRLLGVDAQVTVYDEVLRLVAGEETVRAWVLARPQSALAVDDWPGLLAARGWLLAARGSGSYLREVSAPGVDTKFIERHRSVLAALMGVPPGAVPFIEALGLRNRPGRLRMRFGEGFAGLPLVLSEGGFQVEEMARLDVAVEHAVVLENEVTFLSAPVPAGGLVVFGEGFRAVRLGDLPWLASAQVHYWGDLDTHGFAILDALRAALPQTRSFLMDDATLLAHRERWVREASPTSAALVRLTASERTLHEGLVTDRWGERVRLEQERVDWKWALARWPLDD